MIDKPTAPYSRIMLLGEAYGEEEEKQDRPFVGRSGKLLDSLLERAGILRASCVVTNVFSFRPKGNDVSTLFTGDAEAADPVLRRYPYKGGMLKLGYGKEIKRLHGELVEWKPRVVVALGATALWAMCGRTDIGKCIGTPIPVQSHVVLPAYHPAFLLRSHQVYESQVIDVLLKAKELGSDLTNA